jgi:hypothetical protein
MHIPEFWGVLETLLSEYVYRFASRGLGCIYFGIRRFGFLLNIQMALFSVIV